MRAALGPLELTAGLFTLVGSAFAGLGIWTIAAGRRRARAWPAVPGTVLGATWDRNTDSRYLQVTYTGPDGVPRTFVNRYGSTMLRVPVGRQVRVLVNPARPDDAVLAGPRHGGGCLGAVLTVTGSSFALGGLLGLAVALR
ncbi:DUF3592 domain-containing protein [Motilibacter aurantiacus]|uniref:DUF3592 domain-containing protein n=1 Tax=Motilibacter aurantiacus TaxID=2714955 RepID=UPI001409A6A0|nr:DUF3592 domain-containing protein [Motilibacter aurantiacus]NHC46990.1 DUF3592 domain-containing protein [Motilibacter aurantiacus]